MDAIDFALTILTLRSRFAFSVTSWGRTEAHNKAVGGHANSRHLTFEAADVVLDDPTQLSDCISVAQRLGLKVANEPHCLHLQTP